MEKEKVLSGQTEQTGLKREKKSFLKIGDIFAERYEIKRVLGKGGQGEVYEVVDLQSNTREVLKILTDIESQSSFRKEIAALKSLNNDGIVRIYDGDISSEKPYYTMEYLEGLPLNQLIANYTLSNKDIETIITKLLQALKYLHETGKKLHRDIKPSNVFIVFKEKKEIEGISELEISRVVLIDFGTIRNINVSEETLTRDSSIIRGTYKYMAPEQIDGKECKEATDIYAVGEILYEMVFKKPLFGAETFTELISQKGSSVSNLIDKRILKKNTTKGLKSSFKKFILKATEPNIKNRFQSAEEALNFFTKPPLFYLSSKSKNKILVFTSIFVFILLSVFFVHNVQAKKSVEKLAVKNGTTLSAMNLENDIVWEKKFPGRIISYELVKNPSPAIDKEIIVTTGEAERDERSGGIYLFKENGDTIWEYEMGKEEWVKGCGQNYESYLISIIDADNDGEKEFFFESYNEPWFATLILALKPNGEVYGNLWSCGAFKSFVKFQHQSKTHLGVIAANNKLRTYTFFWFDVSKPFLFNTFGWKDNPFNLKKTSMVDIPLPKIDLTAKTVVPFPKTTIFTPALTPIKEIKVSYNNNIPYFVGETKDGKLIEFGLDGNLPNINSYENNLSEINSFLQEFNQFFRLEEENDSALKMLSSLKNEIPDIPIFKSWFYKFYGMKLKKAGNLKESEKLFWESLKTFPEDATPYVYLSEIYLLENKIDEAEKCIDKYNFQSGVYLAEYGPAPSAYPVYVKLLKEDFDAADKIGKNAYSNTKNRNIYEIPLNFETSFFGGKPPSEELPYCNNILKKDPNYWFWRITNKHFIQNIPLEVSIKEAPKETLEEEDFSQFLASMTQGNEPSTELLSKIKERSKSEIEYRFYYQTCLLYCAEYYDNKRDKENVKKIAKEILANNPIGFVKNFAQQILRK